MSKKNFQGNKILSDTSFLLPILGFETSSRIMEAFQKLGSYELYYYNDISILEALWKIVKVIKGLSGEISRIVEGIIAVKETMKYAPIRGEMVKNAIRMYSLGHRDMVDNPLFSIAVSEKLRFLSVDENLVEFAEEINLAKDSIITPGN